MKYIQLISTSNEEKIKDAEIVYLGNWCKNDDYIINDKKIVNYHWDNRKKLEKDNNYTNELYEKLLSQISVTLNNLHSKSYSNDYWRIICGYWLFYYISVNFERWENIINAFSQFKEINCYQGLNINEQPISTSTREFMNLASELKWNHLTYTKIINYLNAKKKININIFEKKYKNEEFYYNYKVGFKHKFKTSLIKIYLKFFKKIIKKNKIVFYKTYLGLMNEFKINLKYKQLPSFFLSEGIEKKIDRKIRKNSNLNFKPNNLFEQFILEDIFQSMPSEFLENYKEIDKYLESNILPENPDFILSTRSLATDNIFVRYVAKKKEEGSKFIYAQHGGAYGHINFSWAEDHEIKISDTYLTWGWNKNDNKKVKPFYLIKDINNIKFKRSNRINKLCYFVRSRPIYTGRMDSSTGSNQMAKYYNNCLNFAKNLKEINNFNITPRFHEAEFGWNHNYIWKKHNFNKFSFTDAESLNYVYKNYDLLVYSYIGTGFLESLALDKPFILISSLMEWPLRDEASKDFDKLENVKIFFKDNMTANSHLKSIKNNILEWWDSTEVQNVKKYFKQKYARIDIDDRRREELYNLINNLNQNVS